MAVLEHSVPPTMRLDSEEDSNVESATNSVSSGFNMAWRDLHFGIGGSTILEGVSGTLEPGRLLAVMGASGSGKTTMLNIVTGRMKTSGRKQQVGTSKKTRGGAVHFSGQMFSQGVAVQPSFFTQKTAYVFQDHCLYETDTARQCLEFSAYLRLPHTVTKEERTALVDGLLKKLQLDRCANSIVGGQLRRGISGGEQKRVAVGIELIASPVMVCLDEPLTGLDSFNAYTLVTVLKQLSASGTPVMMTLHQPSSEIFHLFDDVLVLHKGQTVYFGDVGTITNHFENLGKPCPPKFNPADHVLFVTQKEDAANLETMFEQWRSSSFNKKLQSKIAAIQGNSHHNVELVGKSPEATPSTSIGEAPKATRGQRWQSDALWALLARDWRRQKVDQLLLYLGVAWQLVLGLCFGWFFFMAGRAEDSSNTGAATMMGYNLNCEPENFNEQQCSVRFMAHWGVLSMIATNMVVAGTWWATSTIQSEFPCFIRERSAGCYSAVPYLVSKLLYNVFWMTLLSAIIILASYWLVGMRGNIVLLILATALQTLGSSAIMYIIACAAKDTDHAGALSVIPSTLSFVFSGIMVPLELIPSSLKWAQWICPLAWGVRLMTGIEFMYLWEEQAAHNCLLAPQSDPLCYSIELRLSLLRTKGTEGPENFPVYVAVLMGLCIFYTICAVLVLWYRSRYAL